MFIEVCIGQPISHGSLTVFPLFREHSRPADCLFPENSLANSTDLCSNMIHQFTSPVENGCRF